VAGARPACPQTNQPADPGHCPHGNDGIGKPEALKHDFAGCWSRRITDEHRLVYKVVDNEIRIAACAVTTTA